MTLSTHIRLEDPVPVEALFHFCQSLLGDPAEQACSHLEPQRWWPRNPAYQNDPQQGLDAWLTVQYGADGPLRHDDDPEIAAPPLAVIDIDFDTTYSYDGPNGAGCGDLHAWFVTEIVAWLAGRSRYHWQLEYTGEWFDSLEVLPKLGDAKKGALR